jgi:hypothetical protein
LFARYLNNASPNHSALSCLYLLSDRGDVRFNIILNGVIGSLNLLSHIHRWSGHPRHLAGANALDEYSFQIFCQNQDAHIPCHVPSKLDHALLPIADANFNDLADDKNSLKKAVDILKLPSVHLFKIASGLVYPSSFNACIYISLLNVSGLAITHKASPISLKYHDD